MTDVLRIEGVTKRFGELVANNNISLSLRAGEVLALLGENGAGKSTLVSILFGHYVADAGTVEVFGEPLPPGDTRAALARGLGMVHQHFMLADNLSVLDNVLTGMEPLRRLRSRRGAIRKQLEQCARDYGLQVDPDALVGTLSVGEKQRVEILKALVRGARILILDEPTAVLTPQESERLFETLRKFVEGGLSLIFISHKLDEVLRVSDNVVVLRAGNVVAQASARETTAAELARWMVGRELQMPRREVTDHGGRKRCVLKVERLTVREKERYLVREVGLEVLAGEIVAIAGVAGNGQQPLAEVLAGVRVPTSGRVEVAGQVMPARARAWIDAGVGRIPEDRVGRGVIADATLAENATADRLRAPENLRWPAVRALLALVDHKAMREQARAIVTQYDVRHRSLDQTTRMLSGGNIQKFILGRELMRMPGLVIANQPTWGLDVGAVAYVHAQLLQARARGAAVLLISEELEEIFALADRVAVMFQGRLGPARPAEDWDASAIGLAMAGQGRHRVEAASP